MIAILLSTYNGSRFLNEQLASIHRQTGVDWQLWIRDDGSTDQTLSILKNAVSQDPRLHLVSDQSNLGAAGSYLELMSSVGDAELYAFCDQDDVWDPDKLDRAKRALAPYADRPALYCTRQRRVDCDLKPIGLSRRPKRAPSFANALVENIVTGCTAVLNRPALELLRQRLPNPGQVIMHDWWGYLVIAAFGTVIYDPQPSLAYRQHDSNTFGERQGMAYWWERFTRVWVEWRNYPLPRQLEEFKRLWGEELNPGQAEQLSTLLELMQPQRFRDRLSRLLKLEVTRQTVVDTFLCYLMLTIRGYR